MNAIELLLPDGRPSGVWACGKCGVLPEPSGKVTAVSSYRDVAEKCCAPNPCEGCGAEAPRHQRYCNPCRERRAFERAEKLEPGDYDGPVCIDGDRYFDGMDALVEHLECDHESPDDWPEWAETCVVSHPTLDADRIFEDLFEDMGEDADEGDFAGVAGFRAACAAFNAANATSNIYHAMPHRLVRVPRVPFPAPESPPEDPRP